MDNLLLLMKVKIILLLVINISFAQTKLPPSLEESKQEPVIYTGNNQPIKEFYDGKLPHAVGVHHFQVFRANRENPSDPGEIGFTYNHQPYLAYWNDKFYLQFLQGLVEEHHPPTRVCMVTSEDGMKWSDPIIAFPEYTLPEINDDVRLVAAGTKSVMHQRMGFYVSPKGRLLISGFYSYTATPRNSPNAGDGIGRVVREVYKNGTFGPIYFIRYNRHAGWNEFNTNYPFYKTSQDKDFLMACESLLEDKLVTLQWWEEDRAKDGFYTIDPSQVPDGDYFSKNIVTAGGAGKALSFYHRSDGVVVALWKNQYSALSSDNGKTWTSIVKNKTLWTDGAKTWGQKTDDERFVIIHNQSATKRNRFPMVAIVGDDGHTFDKMYCLTSEVSPIRYQGIHKNRGTQYFRGIVEGNGNPLGDELWNVYSMNKEDIWISKTNVPIVGSVNDEVKQNFESIASIAELTNWNLYVYKWAPIEIGQDSNTLNKYLILKDEDPYDCAFAERIFPKDAIKKISFRFNVNKPVLGYSMNIEIQDQQGNRPIKLRIDKEWLSFSLKKVKATAVSISPDAWYNVTLNINCNNKNYEVILNGKKLEEKIEFADQVDNVERITFSTGPYRNYVDHKEMEFGAPAQTGMNYESLPAGGEKIPASIYFIDDLITSGE
ncbi:MAG: exo-alpha-sialidase [Ignavibacteriae bacterium]|nr:exo-alpha-sialidase [Ignavibacteriota bacterium]MCB9210434.1 exo-alpha-sialidase [Ignavibacteriales bacterium]MCB9219687.1 exo-alpha-sialidase [Ignavibacteriales bacterium]MCB9259821.1 exo-alpha-sialidase [Ignavibacteriales bacterium]